eukprot:TCALIF_06798-PA protein Name:"Similar to Ino80 Putative DNA helicase Ino80 (Drosophila melanogaster)" AED:0.17 eAED:0.18 QI:0/0/0/0.75/1/0.87/8/0/1427
MSRQYSSDDEDEVLVAFERESAAAPNLTKKQVQQFDKVKRSRRYLDKDVGPELDSQDDTEAEDLFLNEVELFESVKAHQKRKRLRKRVRVAPEISVKKKAADPTQSEKVEDDATLDEDSTSFQKFSAIKSGPGRKKGSKNTGPLTLDQLKARRKRLWVSIMKKEISKAQKARNYTQKEKLTNSKKVAAQCMRQARQKAMQSQRVMKESVWRAKRLTREMQAYWKRFDRVEKQQKRQQEQEAEKQQKMDLQLLETKRQTRKLNFLITQTELYAHFIASKIGADKTNQEADILKKLEDEAEAGSRLAQIDDYNSMEAKTLAINNASQAWEEHEQKKRSYDVKSNDGGEIVGGEANDDRTQPSIFNGKLKAYQLRGLNWLMNLYDQGINGMLADEMGLGKTVQALSMLAYIAEKYEIWGPFLVITPASTLHNWQQEVAKFVPSFKCVPYWGSPQERKVLRHFWDQKELNTKSASFHLVITSYQLVVSDFKYFNRIKWQYLVLDEAQAIKSSSSQRWKLLLEFKCRNRLLLSGTPIQNSMAELWALLHFVMPTLFDSHDEFNDWFSKDIESSAENKSQVDEKQISRLHMILKPFMLRRIKKDVENELTDKVEVLMYCPLTIRQKLLYMGLKRKIRIEDLLQGLGSQSQNSTLTSSLMNLVMQFRKVCNHPELFERREARSPFVMKIDPFVMPKLVFHENIHSGAISTNNHLLYNKLSVFNPVHVHESLKQRRSHGKNLHLHVPGQKSDPLIIPNPIILNITERLDVCDSSFSYLRFVDVSIGEQYDLCLSLLKKFVHLIRTHQRLRVAQLAELFHENPCNPSSHHLNSLLLGSRLKSATTNSELRSLIFTHNQDDQVLQHLDVTLSSMPETISHRLIRTRQKLISHRRKKAMESAAKNCDKAPLDPVIVVDEDEIHQRLVDEIDHVERPSLLLKCQPCSVPSFLLDTCPNVATPGHVQYVQDRLAAYKLDDHIQCNSQEGRDIVLFGSPELRLHWERSRREYFHPVSVGGIQALKPSRGWSNIIIPDKQTLVTDSGKLHVLDGLLTRLKEEGHRVLIYSQMTRMIDLLEEYMVHRKHTFMRLDGSSKISERRDMVADFQQRSDIFVFLLSTRAGGLGINLTAADTVIFYDSDWNPTVDQQAMDRAHRLGQTKQVTVYRLICKGTIEERILQRAREKSEIQRMVIQGGSFKGKPGELKPKEVVSLLLDDDEIEKKYRDKEAEINHDISDSPLPTKKRRPSESLEPEPNAKKPKFEDSLFNIDDTSQLSVDSPGLTIDVDAMSDVTSSRGPTRPQSPIFDFMGEKLGPKRSKRGTGGKRGRPRGSKNKGRDEMEPASQEVSAILIPNGVIPQNPPMKRGPGRPRIKPGGGPLHQGTRGPPPKQAKPSKLKSKGLPAALAATLSAKYNNSGSMNAASPGSSGPKFYTDSSNASS